MNHKHLCMIFGIVPVVCSKVIRVMLQLAVRRLSDNPIAEVSFPSAEKMRRLAGMVQSREPLVDDVTGFMDGVLIPAECTDKRFEQNAFYCGYDCDTMVNNVFEYGPDGKVFFAVANFPGSWADGALTARFLHAIMGSTRSVWIRASPERRSIWNAHRPRHQKGCQTSSSRHPGVPSANQQRAYVASSGKHVGDAWIAGNLPPLEEAPPKQPLSAEAGH
jgi:hypothetical protein